MRRRTPARAVQSGRGSVMGIVLRTVTPVLHLVVGPWRAGIHRLARPVSLVLFISVCLSYNFYSETNQAVAQSSTLPSRIDLTDPNVRYPGRSVFVNQQQMDPYWGDVAFQASVAFQPDSSKWATL